MNSFYSVEELNNIGFSSIGTNVLISRYCSIYGAEKISIGNNVRIDDFCILSGKISLGSYIHIAAYNALYGGNEGIVMENFSTISSHSSVYAVSDDYLGGGMTNPMIPEKYRNVQAAKVVIGKHVIVGSHSVILPGSTLEEGASVGAISLVNRTLKKWGVYAGIPCKKIKERKKEPINLEKKFIGE